MRSGEGLAILAPPASCDPWEMPPIGAVRHTLPNGLRVVLAENHTVPLVWLNWVCQSGFEWDPPELLGLAGLVPLLLRAGTNQRSASQITERVDDLGADLIAGADWDASFLNLQLRSGDLATGAELLIDMACHAAFPDAAVDRLLRRKLAELEYRRRDPRAVADHEFARAVYGASGYGRSPLGTPATLQRINASSATAFHRAHYGPSNSYLVVAGSFDSAVAADLLGSFELPAASPPSVLSPPPFAPEMAARRRVVDVQHARQAEVRVGHASVARNNEDLPALEVLNTVLGCGPSSRLARSLRQRQGLTYDIRSRFAARRRGGPFVVETSIAIEAAATAVDGIKREIEILCDQLVPGEEVEQAKRSLLGADLQRFQSIVGTGLAIGPAAFEEEPTHRFQRRRRAIAAVEPEEVRNAAGRYLHPDRLVEVVVGPAKALQSQFSSNGRHECQPCAIESTS